MYLASVQSLIRISSLDNSGDIEFISLNGEFEE